MPVLRPLLFFILLLVVRAQAQAPDPLAPYRRALTLARTDSARV